MKLYHSAERLTHPACHLNTESDLSTCWMCPLLKFDWKRAATMCYCVQVLVHLWVRKSSMHAEVHACDFALLPVNSDPLTHPVWRTHSPHRHVLWRQTGGRCSLLKSLNIHCHGSFDPCTVELTCMAILWCGEPRRGQLRGSYVANALRTACTEWDSLSVCGGESMLETYGVFGSF